MGMYMSGDEQYNQVSNLGANNSWPTAIPSIADITEAEHDWQSEGSANCRQSICGNSIKAERPVLMSKFSRVIECVTYLMIDGV